AKVLLAAGADVRGYDPAAVERWRMLLPDVEYLNDAYEVAARAVALVLVTESKGFRQLDRARIKQLSPRPVTLAGRNMHSPRPHRHHSRTPTRATRSRWARSGR